MEPAGKLLVVPVLALLALPLPELPLLLPAPSRISNALWKPDPERDGINRSYPPEDDEDDPDVRLRVGEGRLGMYSGGHKVWFRQSNPTPSARANQTTEMNAFALPLEATRWCHWNAFGVRAGAARTFAHMPICIMGSTCPFVSFVSW